MHTSNRTKQNKKTKVCIFRPLQEGEPYNGLGDKATIIGMEDNNHCPWIKGAIEIRIQAQEAVNQDKGPYMLSHTWEAVLKKSDYRGRWQNLYKPTDETDNNITLLFWGRL